MESPVAVVVGSWISQAGLSDAQVARRAGVSASTVHRVVTGKVDPTFGTLREIGLACGVEAFLGYRHASDWAAAAAARTLLEDGYPESEHPAVVEWLKRLPRLAGSEHPIDLVEAAGVASAPAHRPGAHLYLGAKAQLVRVASAGDASGGRWAISGAAGLRIFELGPRSPVPATTLLWCEDSRRVSQLLADDKLLRRTTDVTAANLIVAEADDALFHDSFKKGILILAAPIQILLDCMSFGGQVRDEAVKEASTW